MTRLSRRKLLKAAVGTTAGLSGVTAATVVADRYGLIPPNYSGIYGVGETLTYASQRLLTRHSLAREFSASQISKSPFPNTAPPQDENFRRSQAEGFSNWKVAIDGMVARPGSLSLAALKRAPSSTQITQLVCEEGWSYIAKWTGVRLSHVLENAGILSQARFVVYFSAEKPWWDSIDLADALHPQTLLTYGMNDGELPIGHGGPLRMRVPRQLGYKSVKFVNRLIVTDSLKSFAPQGDYSWYAGI